MANKKHSEDTTETSPVLTDLLLALNAAPDNRNIPISSLKALVQKMVQLDIATGFAYSEGQISYDPVTESFLADTSTPGVRGNVLQDVLVPIYNDTGSPITAGTPVSGSGLYVGGLPSAVVSDADNILHVLGYLGVASAEIADGTIGRATNFGSVRNADTSMFGVAPVFLASGGGLTHTAPLHPTHRFLIGGVTVSDDEDGIIGVSPVRIPRQSASKSYSFISSGAGTDWKGGFYDWNSSDANLTQASPSVVHGTDGRTSAAHVGIVPAAAGTVDTGQVGLQVTGTLDSETGAQIAAQTKIITDDITTLMADVMAETVDKFSGDVTIEFYTVSGSPVNYSLDFNYGFSKYEDFQNMDVTIQAVEAVWTGGNNDTSFDIALMHHKPTGWTYAATGFEPGNGDIVRRSADQAIDGDVATGVEADWKRTSINQFIDGSALEGIIIQIITGAPNAIRTMDVHVVAVSEEFS